VRVRLEESAAGEVNVEVDNPGEIPAEQLPRLFERFYTGNPARRPGGEGTGLGLAIARSIGALHGGSLSAASAAGFTRFTLRLPRGPVA
jgi:two-component system heavy metal sensor histidine kinase CusS